ncbi:uncharacterized protein LOC111108812 [Crassostrea virginica]
MERDIGEIKVKHHGILQNHLDEIKHLQSLMQQTLLALNEMEESNAVSPTIQYSSKIKEFSKLPPEVNVSMPKFIPKQIEREELCRLIGKLTPLSTTLENQGVLQNTIQTKTRYWPRDIAVDRDGTLLYTNSMTVYKVKNDQTEEINTLQGWNLFNLYVTSSGYDGYQSKVVRYSGSTVTQTIQFDDEAGAVVVVNQAGKLRFKYTGPPSPTKSKLFKPRGITTDSEGRILTSDIGINHCIHILDTDGQFLRYIENCDLDNPCGLCVDSDDRLFVSEYSKSSVKKIRYSK